MAMYSCMLLALSTAPSLGSAVASFRALHKVHNNEGRLLSRDARGDSWWWGRKGGLARELGLLRCRSSSSGNGNRGAGCPVTQDASRQVPSNSGETPGGGKERRGLASLGLMRWVWVMGGAVAAAEKTRVRVVGVCLGNAERLLRVAAGIPPCSLCSLYCTAGSTRIHDANLVGVLRCCLVK